MLDSKIEYMIFFVMDDLMDLSLNQLENRMLSCVTTFIDFTIKLYYVIILKNYHLLSTSLV